MTWKIDFGLLAVAWAGLWNKMFGPIMSNFWGRFFQLFVGKKKKNFFWKHCSVRTEKLHRKKVKFFIFFFGKNFFFQKNQFFLGLKIWVYILRPSDQPSVSFYCDPMALYIFHCEKFEIVMSLFSFAPRNYVKHALAWTCCIPCKLGRYISTFVTKIFAKYVCLKQRPSSFLLLHHHMMIQPMTLQQGLKFRGFLVQKKQ